MNIYTIHLTRMTHLELYKSTLTDILNNNDATIYQRQILGSARSFDSMDYLESIRGNSSFQDKSKSYRSIIHFELGMHYIMLENNIDIANFHLDMIKEYPRLYNVLKAEIHCLNGEYEEAIKYYMNDEEYNLYNIGSVYCDMLDDETALKYLFRNYNEHNSFQSAFLIGVIYKSRNNLIEAVRWFKKSKEAGNIDKINMTIGWEELTSQVEENDELRNQIKTLKRIKELDLGSLIYDNMRRYL